MRLSVQSGCVPGLGAANGGQTVLESQNILLNFAFVKFNFIYRASVGMLVNCMKTMR